MANISLATILISACLSVITGYVGSLLNTQRQRRQERRVYGLALLAEIKAIQRGLMRYQQRIADVAGPSANLGSERLRRELRLWRHDLSVYANNSGRIGLFSVRTAIELIEFYHQVRWLDSRIAEFDAQIASDAEVFKIWLCEHQEMLRATRHHSRILSRLLRRDVPLTWSETIRILPRSVRTMRRLAHARAARPAARRPAAMG